MTPQVQLLGFECIQDSLIRDNKGFESLKKQENPIGHLPGLVRDQKNSFSNRLFFSLARFNRFEAVYLAHLMKNSEGRWSLNCRRFALLAIRQYFFPSSRYSILDQVLDDSINALCLGTGTILVLLIWKLCWSFSVSSQRDFCEWKYLQNSS